MPVTPSPAAAGMLALMELQGVGAKQARDLAGTIKEDSDFLEALVAFLDQSTSHRSSVDAFRAAYASTLELLEESHAAGIRAIAFSDRTYPEQLKRILDPPAVLFVKGNEKALQTDKSTAIVGTREPTPKGERDAWECAYVAAELGFAVVSGLAHGCDTHAHGGCLKAKGTGVAVLAHGLDQIYPAANRNLAEDLLEAGGCLVSEHPIGTQPTPGAFVARNRIQSGLSDPVLAIQTNLDGGTMHTAKAALRQHRTLACIKYAKQHAARCRALGNQKCIEEDGAVPIADEIEFGAYLIDRSSSGAARETNLRQSRELF